MREDGQGIWKGRTMTAKPIRPMSPLEKTSYVSLVGAGGGTGHTQEQPLRGELWYEGMVVDGEDVEWEVR